MAVLAAVMGILALGGLVHVFLNLAVLVGFSGTLLDELDNLLPLLIGNESTLDTGGLAATHRREEHIAHTHQLLCSGLVKNDAAFHGGGDGKGNPRGNIGLHQAGDHVGRGTLGGNDQVHPGGTAHLGHAADALLHFFGGHQHQVCQLVNDDDHLGHGLLPGLQAVLVVAGQVTDADLGKQAVTFQHLHHRPLQRTGGLLGVGDHRHIQMGDAIIHAQFHHLGVDHNEPHLIRPGLVQQAENQGVHAHGFARAGGTGNEHMGQLGNVAHHALAADILAQGKAELGLGTGKLGRLDNIPQVDGADDLIGHLNPHGGDFIRDGRDAHIDDAQSQGQIPCQVGDPGQLHTLLQLDIISGDCGAPGNADNGGVDTEAADGPFQSGPVYGDLVPGVNGGSGAAAQQRHRRELIIRLFPGGGYGLSHGLGLGIDLRLDGLAALGRVGNFAAHGNGFQALPLLLLYRSYNAGNCGGFLRCQGHHILRGAQGRLMDDGGLFTRSIFGVLLFGLLPGGFLLRRLFLRLYFVRPAGRLHRLCKRRFPAALPEDKVIIFIPQGDIHGRAAGDALNLPGLGHRDFPGDSTHRRQRVLVHGRVVRGRGPDLHLLRHLLKALAEGADGAGDEGHRKHRQCAVDAEGHLQSDGQQAAQHTGGFQVLAGFKQLPGGKLQVKFRLEGGLIQYQTQDCCQQHRQHQGAEAAQHHRAAPVKAQDHRHQQKHRSAQPIAPAHQALEQIGKKQNEAALGLKITDGDKHRQKQKQHRAQLPPDGNHRLLRGSGVHRLAVFLTVGFAFAVILARCGIFLGLCHEMVPFFGL